MRRARYAVVSVLAWTHVAGAAPDPSKAKNKPAPPPALRGPEPEHGAPNATVKLPSVPVLEVPTGPDGTHGVRELRVMGTRLRGTDLRVSGYVTWIYDCATAVRKPGESDRVVQRRIDDDPTICERPKFYLGDTRDTPPERALWVVDVPRPYNKLERARIQKADRTPENYPDRCEPDPKRPRATFCTPLAVGDYVTVSGRFDVSSPHGERNSDGLIVFASLARTTPPAKPTLMKPPAAKRPPPLQPSAIASVPASDAVRATSIAKANEATKKYGMRDFAGAAQAYRDALKTWAGNHVAWYGLAGVQIGQGDWAGATRSMAKAFELAPSNAQYAMVYGYTVYEAAIADARQRRALLENVDPARVTIDASTLDFSRAEQLLRHAVRLDDQLWRAHYYLGRIARDGEHSQDAAEELTKALAAAPSQSGPWIALAELYRKWQLPDAALQVATQGTQLVADTAVTDLWYVVGMVHDDLRQDVQAVASFTKALELDPANHKATFQRGLALYRLGKLVDSQRDLEAFLASPGDGFAKQQARIILGYIAEKAGKRR